MIKLGSPCLTHFHRVQSASMAASSLFNQTCPGNSEEGIKERERLRHAHIKAGVKIMLVDTTTKDFQW